MEAFEAIFGRHSVRRFNDRQVSQEDMEQVLRAAMSAPSAGNEQPWHFVVIDDKVVMEKVHAFHPYAGALKTASAGIVVCGDLRLEKHKGYWVQDCAAAVQNLLLAVHALGLGAVWLGVYPREDRVAGFRELLGLPQGVIPLALVAVGYPAERKQQADRFDAGRLHKNHW